MPSTAPVRNLIHLFRDRGYRFRDRDPDLDAICRIITDSGLSFGEIIDEVYDQTGEWISWSTLYNWTSGRTKRPSNAYMTAVARALGYQRNFTRRPRSGQETAQ